MSEADGSPLVVVRRCAGAFDSLALAQGIRPVRWPAMSEPDGSPKAERQVSRMVRKERFELSRYCYRQPLKLVRLPVPPLSRGGSCVDRAYFFSGCVVVGAAGA